MGVLAVTASAWAGASSQSSGRLTVFTAQFGGEAKSVLGSTKEWYSPSSGVYRIDRRSDKHRTSTVYDGHAIVIAQAGLTTRITGGRDFMRIVGQVNRESVLAAPAIVIFNSHRSGKRYPHLTAHTSNGGRTIDAVYEFPRENGSPLAIAIHVEQGDTVAASSGVLARPRGRSVGEFHQAKPGAHPTFGEHGYWFGATLGPARAVTSLENWGADAFTGPTTSNSPGPQPTPKSAHYTTIYRLPSSVMTNPLPVHSPFPGIGDQGPRDIRVECSHAAEGPLPGLLPGSTKSRLALADGEHATLYMSSYTQGSRGVAADIVVGTTVCLVHGLIAPARFRRLAPTLRPA